MWRGGDDGQPMLASMVFQEQRVDSAFRAVKRPGSVRISPTFEAAGGCQVNGGGPPGTILKTFQRRTFCQRIQSNRRYLMRERDRQYGRPVLAGSIGLFIFCPR
jgi:hypothetical protein